jgi:uncharacterized protein YodC (DUF2158 family)
MEFTIGENVRLRAGGPLMTITASGKDAAGNAQVVCTWFDKDRHQQSGCYPIAAIARAAVPTATRVAMAPRSMRRGSGDGTGWMGN